VHCSSKQSTRGRGYAQIVNDYAEYLNAQYTDGDTRFETDAQGAYSLTPLHIAEQRNRTQLPACGVRAAGAHVIIDATAGVGGDAVSFMLGFPHSTVHALEPNADRVRMLQHNVAAMHRKARVPTGHTYCVQAEFADLFGRLAQLLSACTVLYLDPEWGGPAYHNEAQAHGSMAGNDPDRRPSRVSSGAYVTSAWRAQDTHAPPGLTHAQAVLYA